ncbi:MAG: hypothetical protein Q9191_004047, partial [Dirinaria sp. TL-2023a]
MAALNTFPTFSSELIFPSNSQKLSIALSGLRRSNLSIHNRLRSIIQDSAFAQHVASDIGLPLIANERCGSWYIPPDLKAGSAYFKSTDGHIGQWSFSLRRLNLHLLDIVAQHEGCVIVDSTRRGKSMPDALSKTVPIWCAVINSLLWGNERVFLPQDVVAPSERAQIQKRVDGWVKDVEEALDLDLENLRSKITKPLRPVWIIPDDSERQVSPYTEAHFSVVCCTVSHRNWGPEASDNGYVQGAADDSESWALGITPEMLWAHKEALLNASEDDLPMLVQELKSTISAHFECRVTLVRPTETIFIGTLEAIDSTSFDGIIICSDRTHIEVLPHSEATKSNKTLELACGKGKLGSRALRNQLQHIPPFIEGLSSKVKTPKLLFACPTGKDLSAGVALAVLCMYFDNG